MPKGHVKWFDVKNGSGVVEHNGREYAVQSSEIDDRARVAGAPVHFDIQRSERGDEATDVTLREGTRTSPQTHRYGDQTGAHHPSDKGQTRQADLNPRIKRRRAYTDRPRRLAEEWVAHLASGQIDWVVDLYAPDASVHEGEQTIAGGDRVRSYLKEHPLNGADPAAASIDGAGDDRFLIRWAPMEDETASLLITLRVSNGRIVEQWTEELS